MKKLMIAAAAALCATVGMSEGVSSQNIVGYMGKSFANGYTIASGMFLNITNTTGAINIQDIVPSVASGTIESGDLALFVINPARTTVGTYTYEPEKWNKKHTEIIAVAGWYVGDDLANVSFEQGSGYMVECSKAITLTYAGLVNQTSPGFIAPAAGYYRVGNMTPAPVSIQSLTPVASSAIESGEVAIFTYNSDRSIKGTYTYEPEKWNKKHTEIIAAAGWYVGDDLATLTLQPGDGFVLEVSRAMTITFPSPVPAE